MTPSYFVDAATLLYAFGGPHENRAGSLALVRHAAEMQCRLHINTEVVQEFLWHRLRRVGRVTAVDDARDIRALCVTHPVTDVTVDAMIDLVESTGIRGRDALHAASALQAGFDSIVTTDRGFLAVRGLRAVHPADVEV